MKPKMTILLATFLFLGFLYSLPMKVNGAPNAIVLSIQPASHNLGIGETVTVDIAISDVADLYGAAIEITFDPAILEVVDANGSKSGVQIITGSCPLPDFVVQNTADNTTGVINYDVASLSPSAPCNGSGIVASITFQGKANGTSSVVISASLLSDTNGSSITASTQDGSITVGTVTNALLWIDPPASTIGISETVTVDITISGVTNLYGTAIEIQFDPSSLEVVDTDGSKPGVQIAPGSCPSPDFIVQNLVDNTTGVINYDVASLSPSEPCNGNGVVASVTFHGKATGTVPVSFNDSLLSDTNGTGITHDTQDGSITVAGDGAKLSILPAESEVAINKTSAISVNLSNVSNVYGIQLELSFDSARVQVVDADAGKSGVQIATGTCPAPDFVVQNTVDNTSGTILYAVTQLNPTPTCDGGMVAGITFQGLSEGVSLVQFISWVVTDPDGIAIPVGVANGSVNVIANGTISGTIELQSRTNYSGVQVCALENSVQIACDTTDAAGAYQIDVYQGSYTVAAVIGRFLDSQKTNVSVVAGQVTNLSKVKLLGGDVNDDCTVNIQDLSFMGSRFGFSLGDPGWDPKADINADNTINIQDLSVGGSNFGKSCPVPWP